MIPTLLRDSLLKTQIRKLTATIILLLLVLEVLLLYVQFQFRVKDFAQSQSDLALKSFTSSIERVKETTSQSLYLLEDWDMNKIISTDNSGATQNLCMSLMNATPYTGEIIYLQHGHTHLSISQEHYTNNLIVSKQADSTNSIAIHTSQQWYTNALSYVNKGVTWSDPYPFDNGKFGVTTSLAFQDSTKDTPTLVAIHIPLNDIFTSITETDTLASAINLRLFLTSDPTLQSTKKNSTTSTLWNAALSLELLNKITKTYQSSPDLSENVFKVTYHNKKYWVRLKPIEIGHSGFLIGWIAPTDDLREIILASQKSFRVRR